MKLTTILDNASKCLFEKTTEVSWDSVPEGEKQIFRSHVSSTLHALMDAGLKVDQSEEPAIVNPHETIADETRFVTEIATDLHVSLDLDESESVERAGEIFYACKDLVGKRYM